MPTMPQDLSRWDITPKQGNGTLPLTISVQGYMSPQGYNPIYDILDGQEIILQIAWDDGSFHDTVLKMVTRQNGSYHGYFSGSVDLTEEGGNGIWIYTPNLNRFRVRYGGSSTLSPAESPVIEVDSRGIQASVNGVRVRDSSTGTWYSCNPEGQVATITAGAQAEVVIGLKNNSGLSGNLWIEVKDQNGAPVLTRTTYTVAAGQTQPVNFSLTANKQYVLTITVGH